MRDTAAYGVMLGLGEAYLSAFAIYLGASEFLLGMLAAAPPLLGAVVQVYAARQLDRRPRRRPFYLAGAVLQMLIWPVIIATIWMPRAAALPVLMISVTLYYAGIHFSSPAWNSTMGDLVPFDARGRYFAWRNRACIVCQWLATVVAGLGLHVYASGSGNDLGYTLIFSGALAARLVSLLYLARMKDPDYRPREEDRFSLMDFLRALPRSNFARFVLYFSATSLSVNIAAPYFTLYMLRDLGLSYLEFMIAQAMVIAGQIIQLFTWGTLSDRYGNRKVLVICGLCVTALPGLWLLGRSLPYVLALQFLGGAAWSGFNLSAANFLLDAVSPPKRARCVAYFNLFNGAGTFVGGLAGALLAGWIPATVFGVTLLTPLYGVMFVSLVMRAATQVLFLPRFREVRDVQPISTLGLFFRATHLKSVTDLAIDFLSGYLRGGRRQENEKW